MVPDASFQSGIVVVLFTHNNAGTIEETLRCLHDQVPEIPYLRLIAVDLGSTDGTVALVKRLKPEGFYQFNQQNAQLGRAFNLVLEGIVDTEEIIFLQGHTLPDTRRWIGELLRSLRMAPETALVISPRLAATRAFPVINPEISRSSTGSNESWIEDPGIIMAGAMRRRAWSEHRLRTDLEGYELGEWAHRVERDGWTIATCEDARVQDVQALTLREIYQQAFRAAYTLARCRGDLSGVETFALSGRRMLRLMRRNMRDLGNFVRRGQLLEWLRIVLGRVFLTLGEVRGYTCGQRQDAAPAPAGSPGGKRF